MKKKERIEEEFELKNEDVAFDEYSYIASFIAVNYSLIADEISQFGSFEKGLIVDIGTGLGDMAIEVAKRYPESKVIGMDFSKKALDEADNKAKKANLGNATFQFADVHNIPLDDKSVDLIVSHGLIHHLRAPAKALSEIYRILKPDALAYITDLRRDAPDEIVKEVEKSLPNNQAKAFTNSINASYVPEELEKMIIDLGITDFSVSGQKFSRGTILKNRDLLRKSSMRKADYTKLSQTIMIKR